jgi:chorismate mutase
MIDHTRSSESDIGRAIHSLERQVALCESLAALAPEQSRLISARDGEGLVGLLSKRQSMIDGIAQEQHNSGSILEVVLQGEAIPPAAKARIERLISQIQDSLAAISGSDARDEAEVRARLDEIASELTSSTAAKSARHAYGMGRGDRTSSPRFTDRKG